MPWCSSSLTNASYRRWVLKRLLLLYEQRIRVYMVFLGRDKHTVRELQPTGCGFWSHITQKTYGIACPSCDSTSRLSPTGTGRETLDSQQNHSVRYTYTTAIIYFPSMILYVAYRLNRPHVDNDEKSRPLVRPLSSKRFQFIFARTQSRVHRAFQRILHRRNRQLRYHYAFYLHFRYYFDVTELGNNMSAENDFHRVPICRTQITSSVTKLSVYRLQHFHFTLITVQALSPMRRHTHVHVYGCVRLTKHNIDTLSLIVSILNLQC